MDRPPATHRCISCDVPMESAHLGGFRLDVRPLGKRRGVVAEPWVCPQCGRVDFFAATTDRFRNDEPEEP